MKIALCLRGLSYGRNSSRDPKTKGGIFYDIFHGYYYFREYLLNKYDVDVFIHTWNHEREKEIIELYQPKKLTIDRVTPEVEARVLSCSPGVNVDKNTTCYARHSNYYSLQAVNKLRKEYQEETGVHYDLIIHSRFEVKFELKMDLNDLNSDKFYLFFKPTRKFIMGQPMIFDYVFISKQESLIDEFCQVWERLPEIFKFMDKNVTRKKGISVYDLNNHILLGNYLYKMCPVVFKHLDFLQPDKLFCSVIYDFKSLDELEREEMENKAGNGK